MNMKGHRWSHRGANRSNGATNRKGCRQLASGTSHACEGGSGSIVVDFFFSNDTGELRVISLRKNKSTTSPYKDQPKN